MLGSLPTACVLMTLYLNKQLPVLLHVLVSCLLLLLLLSLHGNIDVHSKLLADRREKLYV